MYKFYKPEELVKSECFVREPVDEIRKAIETSEQKKIIVGSERGSGRSTLLTELEGKNISNNTQYINMQFDAVGFLNKDAIIDDNFFEHYYEITIAKKLMQYLAKYYGYTLNKNFNEQDEAIKNIVGETNKYLNDAYYKNIKLNNQLSKNEITENLIKEIKEKLNIDKLGLAIDRFDWINASNGLDQKCLETYFPLFDQIIITCDDEDIKKKERHDELIQQNYQFINLNYGKDINIIKAIIRKRINEYNANKCFNHKNFNEDLLTDEVYQYLIKKTKGNMNLMINSLAELINSWEFCNDEFNLEKELSKAINEESKSNQSLVRSKKPIKLYI